MSYIRFGEDDSDVYVFASTSGKLECCGCSMPGEPWQSRWFASTAAMIEHLRAHQAAEQHVPERVFIDLQADDAENFPPGDAA